MNAPVDVLAVMLPKVEPGICWPGAKAPSSMLTRHVADRAGVSQTVALRQLRQLEADGLVIARRPENPLHRNCFKGASWQLTDLALVRAGGAA